MVRQERGRCSFSSVVAWCAGLMALLLAQGAGSPLFAQGAEDYIVAFREGTAPSVRAAVAQGVGAAVRFNYENVNAAAVRVPNANALAALRNDPSVLSVIPDRPVFMHQRADAKGGNGKKPGGGGSAQVVPPGVARVGVAYDGSNGAGVGVAIVDTGIDFAHPDLAVAPDWFSAFGGSCQDDEGHGTHVAGTVAALDNAIDVVGVAPGATLYCVKVLDGSGSGSDATVLAGLDWVETNRAAKNIRVVNMSLGRPVAPNDDHPLRSIIQTLHTAGVAVVVSAGNDPGVEVTSQVPATYPEVFAIASTTAVDGTNRCRFLQYPILADTASYFTTDGAFNPGTGIGVTASAPGDEREDVSRGCMISSVGVLSTALGGGTTRKSGTSMSAPHVAGIVARMFERGESDVEMIRGLLRGGSDLPGVAPRHSPSTAYSFDGEHEGVAQAP